MQRFEFKVVPAPRRGEKARGIKTTEERFAYALTEVLNEMGRDGWEYVRADVLPCDERVGLTGSKTTFQNMLVFRRDVSGVQAGMPPSESLPAGTRILPPDPVAAPPRVGSAGGAPAGPSPALGPAAGDLAAE